LKAYGVIGENIEVKCRQSVSSTIGDSRFRHNVLICPLSTEASGTLGTDFLRKIEARIDFNREMFSWRDREKGGEDVEDSKDRKTALTIILGVKDGRRSVLRPKGEQSQYEVLASFPDAKEAEALRKTCLVKIRESVNLETNVRQIVTGIVPAESGQRTPSLVCIEPAKIPLEGVLAARTIT
jgi:hypothetical protein